MKYHPFPPSRKKRKRKEKKEKKRKGMQEVRVQGIATTTTTTTTTVTSIRGCGGIFSSNKTTPATTQGCSRQDCSCKGFKANDSIRNIVPFASHLAYMHFPTPEGGSPHPLAHHPLLLLLLTSPMRTSLPSILSHQNLNQTGLLSAPTSPARGFPFSGGQISPIPPYYTQHPLPIRIHGPRYKITDHSHNLTPHPRSS